MSIRDWLYAWQIRRAVAAEAKIAAVFLADPDAHHSVQSLRKASGLSARQLGQLLAYMLADQHIEWEEDISLTRQGRTAMQLAMEWDVNARKAKR